MPKTPHWCLTNRSARCEFTCQAVEKSANRSAHKFARWEAVVALRQREPLDRAALTHLLEDLCEAQRAGLAYAGISISDPHRGEPVSG